ncbi:c-type cytochrome [Rivibacter subsaxonicus]|uniref:Cytochrome c553 n=1 Tax=Rivibacter subsaxonicus TaxID=457575 RepID=A0A4Q7VNH7_9BURK|nr:c-type cytochrome [Rivibacter subsaxonicus]RZT97688.1 cytochrome c553 [Rivibacter subsaxonicus]
MIHPLALPRVAIARLAPLLLLLTSALPLHAQTTPTQALYARSLAATCANCHGTDGRAVAGQAMVSLAGMPEAYFIEQMKAFRDGKRPATVMHQLAKGYSDEQIAALAAYFAAQPK